MEVCSPPGSVRFCALTKIVVVTGFTLVTMQVLVRARTPLSALPFASFSCEQFQSLPTIQRKTSDFFFSFVGPKIISVSKPYFFYRRFQLASCMPFPTIGFRKSWMILQSAVRGKCENPSKKGLSFWSIMGVILHFATPESKSNL